MLPSAEPLLLSILGIDNAFEASGLIRLFHAAEPVPDPAPDQWRETVLPPYPWVIRLVVTREDGWFDAQARVFHHGRLSGGARCVCGWPTRRTRARCCSAARSWPRGRRCITRWRKRSTRPCHGDRSRAFVR
jgi:hypothetical protein